MKRSDFDCDGGKGSNMTRGGRRRKVRRWRLSGWGRSQLIMDSNKRRCVSFQLCFKLLSSYLEICNHCVPWSLTDVSKYIFWKNLPWNICQYKQNYKISFQEWHSTGRNGDLEPEQTEQTCSGTQWSLDDLIRSRWATEVRSDLTTTPTEQVEETDRKLFF